MAVNGIIAGIGDKEKNINEILPELDASILAILLDSGVYYVFDNKINIDYDLSKVYVPKFFCIVSGFKVFFDTPTELYFEKPVGNDDTFYYHVLVEAKTNVIPNTANLIIIRSPSPELPEEYYRQDNLVSVKGVHYLDIVYFQVKLSDSGTTDLDFNAKINKVNFAIKSDIATKVNGQVDGNTVGITQSKGTSNKTIATTEFVKNAINFGNDTISQNTPSGESTTISVNELTRIGGLVLGKFDYSIEHSGSGYLSLPFKIGTLPEGYRPKTPSNFSTTAFGIVNIGALQGSNFVQKDQKVKCDITINDNNLYLDDFELLDEVSINKVYLKNIHIYPFMFGYIAEDI